MLKEKNFEKYLENNFGIIFPPNIRIFFDKGIRVGNKLLLKRKTLGVKGYAASDGGFNPTNAIIQNFRHLATKNIVDVDEENAKKFAVGKNLDTKLNGKERYVIVKYKTHIVGLGYFDGKKIINKIPEKRRREIVNSI